MRPGDEAFVLADGPGDARHIAFKTRIALVHDENAQLAFVVIDGGVQFLPENGELIAHSAGRTFYLLPKNDKTIESVRAYTKQQRAERHARREAKKAYTDRLEQARQHVTSAQNKLNYIRYELNSTKGRVAEHDRALGRMRAEVTHLETMVPMLEKRLIEARESLMQVEKESQHPSN